MTVHHDIDNLLAADLHGELSESERTELQNHLLDCADCRQAFQETKLMNQLLEEKLEQPDPAFEQRLLADFRKRVPEKNRNILQLIVDLMRLRGAQIAGAAAVLLALVQVGRLITGERSSGEMRYAGLKDIAVGQVANSREANTTATLSAASGGRGGGSFSDQVAARAPLMSNPYEAAAKKPEAPPPPMSGSERVIVTGSNIPTAEEAGPNPTLNLNRDFVGGVSSARAEGGPSSVAETPAPAPALANRKLIRNAEVDLEIVSFQETVQKVTAFASEARGYVATTSSEKQENGKLKGEIVAKVLPENLDRFLEKVRGLGDLKNQTIGSEDVTKQYFDTDARLKNSRVMEQRLIDMVKTKTGKVSDLLEVEKELARVREGIEKMQGDLKYWDSQVQFATVTISLAEKDLEEPAAFLLKEHAQLSLFASDVEKTYNDIKNLASPKVQITSAQLDRDNSGRVVAHMGVLIVPEESESIIARVKGSARIANFEDRTEREAQGGNGLSENAKTKRDKVELNVNISRETEEQPVQETSLRILTSNVDQNAARLKDQAAKTGAEIRNSTFARDPDGREVANISLRIAMKDYPVLLKSLDQLGQVKDVSVQRQDKTDKNGSEENAPADLSIQIYSQGNIVSSETGLFATLRNTIGQSAGAIMWSVRMIGVAIAFLAPWVITLVAVVWIAKGIVRARRKL